MPTPFRFRPPVWLDETASTSDYLKEMISRPEPPSNGTVIVARKQTAGRGRMGANWLSAREGDVTFSFVYMSNKGPDQVGTLPLACGLAVRDFLASPPLSLPASCKWPNDIFVGDGKICGILTEGGVSNDGILRLIIGIGLNGRFRPGRDETIGRSTTSIEELLLEKHAPDTLLSPLLQSLEQRIAAWEKNGFEGMRTEFTANLWGLGRMVTARVDGGSVAGTVSGLGGNGELVITLPDGTVKHITSVSAIEEL